MGYVVLVEDMFGKGFVPKDIPEMTATITIYNNDTNPSRPAEERADREYKVAMTRFLKDVFSQ
jgi:hypothetical protein